MGGVSVQVAVQIDHPPRPLEAPMNAETQLLSGKSFTIQPLRPSERANAAQKRLSWLWHGYLAWMRKRGRGQQRSAREFKPELQVLETGEDRETAEAAYSRRSRIGDVFVVTRSV